MLEPDERPINEARPYRHVRSYRARQSIRGLGYGLPLALITCASTFGQQTARVSLGQTGAQANNDVNLSPAGRFVSDGGRFAVWDSYASNLVSGDTNAAWDVFVRDSLLGTTERVSVSSSGAQGNANSEGYGISMSSDGRFIVFESVASNLVSGDTNGVRDIFLRDRMNGTTERISVSSSGTQASDWSIYPSVSDDGRFVAFTSPASNLVPGDTNLDWDVFVRDRQSGTTERVSVSTSGPEGNGTSYKAAISGDGRFVTFESDASNLVANDTNGTWDVFVHDRQTGTTELASVSTGGVPGNSGSWMASISGDGRYVAFQSISDNLVTPDVGGYWDIFVRDRLLGTTERVSVSSSGAQANWDSTIASMSEDGRYISFGSGASNLAPGDTNNAPDTYVYDRASHTTERITVRTDGSQISGGGGGSISADGRYVAFLSDATDVVPGDTNGHTDMFLRDRFFTDFTSVCDAGQAGVTACPCGNPPSGAGRGCDNSAATGGAVLSATGSCHLPTDSLVFATIDELPHATSILLQGTALAPGGIAFGQGVRCSAGIMKRLFVKTAVNGGMRAPDFAAGDPTVSARSTALGDAIQVGEQRFYVVYYRDPAVLGGCSAMGTFNCTQTGQVLWSP